MQRKVKILFLAANSKDTVRLRLDEEHREIEHKILLAQKKDCMALVNKGAVRIGDLQFYLNQEKPNIVHFSGHGTRTSGIVLEDASGNSKCVTPKALQRVFKVLKDDIRCVVLNSCYSLKQAQAISRHIDCVIGMPSSINDEAAIAFSTAFYLAIASERSIKNAFDQGIAQLMLCGIPEEYIPQLLLREKVQPNKIFLLESNPPSTPHVGIRAKPEKKLTMLTAEEIAFSTAYKLREYFSLPRLSKYLIFVKAVKRAADQVSNLEVDRLRNKHLRATELYLATIFEDDQELYDYVNHIHACMSGTRILPEEIWRRICDISSKVIVEWGWTDEFKR